MNRENRFLRRQLIRKFMYNRTVKRCIAMVRVVEDMINFMVRQ